jgi:uncharacterized protein
MRLLLDVNVWVALFDEAHMHHALACKLIAQKKLKIASCALTENGVLRILNMPNYSTAPKPGFEAIRQMMRRVCSDIDHAYWGNELSLIRDDVIDWSRVMGHNQITDAYLLALAVKHGGALATLDHRVALSAVRGANSSHLLLL